MAVFTTARVARRSRARRFAPPPARIDLGTWIDGLLAGAFVACAAVASGSGLGLSGHEWSAFASARLAAHGGSFGLFDAIRAADGAQRLAWIAAATLEYAVFGVDPAGYRLVFDALIAAVAVASYAALRRCAVPRSLALATALVFGALPGSANVFGATREYLGLAFLLGALHAALSVRGAPPRRALGLAVASLAATSAAALCSAPMALLAIPVAAFSTRRGWTSRALAGATVATAVAALAYYGLVDGVPSWPVVVDRIEAMRRGPFGLGADPSSALALGSNDLRVGAIAGVATAIAVLVVALRPETALPSRARRLARAGTALGALGILAWPSGDGLAGTCGAAMTFVGVVAASACLVHGSRLRAGILAAAVGIACGSAATVAAHAADSARDAARLQVRLIADVVERTAGLRTGAVVLIAARCPAESFRSRADATSALRLVLDRTDVRADVVTAAARPDAAGLLVGPATEAIRYPYRESTVGYDAFMRRVTPLVGLADARRFLAGVRREAGTGCAGPS